MLTTSLLYIFTPFNLLLAATGTVIGIIFGAIPGLSASMGIAMFLPVTFSLTPESAIILLGSIFVGGISGGLISAILLGVPGTPASVATCFDGLPMTKNGQSAKALAVGIISSFIGTVGSVFIAMFFCPFIARFAVKLGPWELFSLCFCAIILVVTISKGDLFKGLIAAFLGMLLACVGIAPIDGAKRFSYGIPNLMGGFNMLAVMLGIFAMSNLINNYCHGDMESPEIDAKNIRGFGISVREFTDNLWLIVKAFLIGLWIGFLPGLGGGLSNLVAYAQAKASSKTPEKFGTGCIEGIMAPEVANNASVGGAVIPMISLGIPGDTSTALILSGLMIHGIEAGPLLMTNSKLLVYVFFGTLILGALMTFGLQMICMRTFPYILKTPYHYLYAAIFVICFVGVYSDSSTLFSCGLMIVFTVIGMFCYFGKLPTSPFILGFILGPQLELNLRKGLTYSSEGFSVFLTRPISGTLLLIAALSIFWPYVKDKLRSRKAARPVS